MDLKMEKLRRDSPALVAAALLLVGVSFATFRLTESPSFWYDEGWYIQAAANLATAGVDGLQLSPGHIEHLAVTTVGYPLIYPLALWMKIFGTGVAAARSLMAIIIVGFLAAAFALARRLLGQTIGMGRSGALWALALLVLFPPLYGNGKSVLGEVPGMLFFMLSLFFWSKAKASTDRRLWVILSGVFAGLCAATKPVYLVFLPALLVGAIIEYRRKTLSLSEIAIGVAAALAPLAVWLFVQFGAGDSASGIVGYYANPYHENIVHVVLKNFVGLFKSASGLFTLALGGAWAAGIIVAWKRGKAIAVEEVMAAIFAGLVFLAFLRTAGWYRYLFPMQATALLFLPGAFGTLSDIASGRWPARRFVRRAAPAILGLLALLGLYQLCFASWVADGYGSHRTAELAAGIGALPASRSVLFYNAPEAVPFIKHRNYYQYILPAAGVIGAENLALAQKGSVDLIVLETEGYHPSDPVFKLYKPTGTVDKFTVLTAIKAR
jgi:4-amino-4-deoxy-L-arabinose transferase-like glycosyltransferase